MTINDLYHRFNSFLKECATWYAWTIYSKRCLANAKRVAGKWERLSRSQRKEIAKFWGIKHPMHSDFITHEVMLNVKGEFDVRYCPESVFRLHLDDKDFYRPWTDKNYYERFQPGLPVPHTFVRNINGCFLDHNYNPISKEEAKRIITKALPLIVKPSILSGEGKNIKLISNENEIDDVFSKYGKDYLFQELIIQCSELQKLSPHSVASMRIITAIVNGRPVLLKKHLLCNMSDAIAVNCGVNSGEGVVIIRIDDDGKLDNTAYLEDTRKLQTLPSGVSFGGLQIPSFREAVNLVLKAHESMPMLDIIGWDVTIDKDNKPVMIEWNQRNMEIYHSQLTQGPLFGEYTDYFAEKAKKVMRF